jgi:8-oxo-dGTP pyrophosphatase MutT (NUDIX family)
MNRKIHFGTASILITDGEYQRAENQVIIDTNILDLPQVKTALSEFIQQSGKSNLIFVNKNVNSFFEFLKSEFQYIEAAGGLIRKEDKYLFIHRLGKWDLPKGKIDPGENAQQAAIRECMEECSISGLEILNSLPDTYHIYPHKGSHVLKTTYWFLMSSTHTGPLIPQTEENIQKAEWLSTDEIKNLVLEDTYPSVKELINSSLGIA